ncbi:hypothetical protein QOT17_020361 [Balamuthia mandrillaris]
MASSCSVCVPVKMDLQTNDLFSLVDMSSVKLNLGNMLASVVGNYEVTVPVGELGEVAEFLGMDDFTVAIPLADLVKALPAVQLNLDSSIQGAQREAPKVLNLANMLSFAPDLCFEVTRAPCEDRVNLGIKLGKTSSDRLIDLSIDLGDYLGCMKEKSSERSFNIGAGEATVEWDYDNKQISVCASLFSDMIRPNAFCLLLNDILWTMRGISFCPQISIDSSSYSNTIEFLCQTLGEIDECNRIETFEECKEHAGCGWCSARRACINTANPLDPCEGCPSWVVDLPSTNSTNATIPNEQNGNHTISVSSMKVPFLEEVAVREGREEAERIEVRYCGDYYDYADETGKVSFERWYEAVGAYLDATEVNATFAATDENGDNVIDYKEYCTYASVVSTIVPSSSAASLSSWLVTLVSNNAA